MWFWSLGAKDEVGAIMERLSTIFRHLNDADLAPVTRQVAALPNYQDKPDDVVVVSALRTPIARARRGQLKVQEM